MDAILLFIWQCCMAEGLVGFVLGGQVQVIAAHHDDSFGACGLHRCHGGGHPKVSGFSLYREWYCDYCNPVISGLYQATPYF